MQQLELTFPGYYHCAIKKASPITQYNSVNLLLTGSVMMDTTQSIQETAASIYVNGVKPLPKDLIYDLLCRPEEELIRRFRELQFFDASAIADAIARLLTVVNITPSAKDELLSFHTPGQEYLFLCQVFRAALKNSAFKTQKLEKKDKALIQACRDNALPTEETVVLTPKEEAVPPAPVQHSEVGKEAPSVLKSYLKFFLDDTAPAGCFDDQLFIRTWHPNPGSSAEDIANYLYSFIEEAEHPFVQLDYADLLSVTRGPHPSSCFMLECVGEQEEVLHYLTDLHRLRGAAAVAAVLDMHPEGSFGMIEAVCAAIIDSMGNDIIFYGVRLEYDLPENLICVRLMIHPAED